MTAPQSQHPDDGHSTHRPARLMIAGEFSAGKTRLINGLLGQDLLPSNVTATEMPAIWLTAQPAVNVRIDRAGKGHELDGLNAVDTADTAFCLMSCEAPFLQGIDLIDTPGNSDPNMPAEAWQRMLRHADAVVWCSSAVQAWRQSEKSAWQEMPEALRSNAVLLLTHADRLGDAQNRDKVLRRVQREAAQHFAHILMVSLVDPQDLARVAACLTEVAANLPALPGKDHAIVSAALAAGAADAAARAQADPQTVAETAAPDSAAADDVEDRVVAFSLDESERRNARQARRLARRLRQEARQQQERDRLQDPARQIWCELVGEAFVPANLPEPLRTRIEQYFERINQELVRIPPQDLARRADAQP